MCVEVMGRFRYIAWVECPYRVAGKASALRAGKRAPGTQVVPIHSCGQSVSARREKRYAEIGPSVWGVGWRTWGRLPWRDRRLGSGAGPGPGPGGRLGACCSCASTGVLALERNPVPAPPPPVAPPLAIPPPVRPPLVTPPAVTPQLATPPPVQPPLATQPPVECCCCCCCCCCTGARVQGLADIAHHAIGRRFCWCVPGLRGI